jgi:hypothetical protein
MGKKAEEREARIKAARQRMRLHTFTALALLVCDKWRTNPALQEDIAELPANERRFLKMQVAKCHKSVQAVVRMLHAQTQWPSQSSAFFQDASALMQMLLERVCNAERMPEYCTYIAVQSVVTYLVYAAIYELQAMVFDERAEVQAMLRDMGILGDHLIQNDSPYLDALNDVFWATRNTMHAGAPLPVWDFSKCLPGSAEYTRRHGRAA